jgi:Flp pilus assembly protein TadD
MSRRVIALLVIVTSCGCASVEKRGFVSRFVREGTPSVDLGGPRPGALPALRVNKSHSAISTNVSRVTGGTLEIRDPALRNALTRLTLAPTIDHHLAVSRAYRQNGIMDHALDYLSRSLEINGPSSVIYDARARLWREWGSPQFGLTDAHWAVYLEPDSPVYHNTLGTLLFSLGQRAEAEDQFRRALTLAPDAWYAVANLCHVNLVKGNTREAIPLCRRATELRKKQRR